MPTGAELFVDTVWSLGIRHLFTLVGDHLNDVLPLAAARGMHILDMRHESGVTHAAEAWGRLYRRPALALVTGGPGHTNSLTGTATAQLAGTPLIAVSGSRASNLAERGAFQDIDQVGMTRPIVKWAAEPTSAAQIPLFLRRAYDEANTGRKGAVHLTIPVNLFASHAEPIPWSVPPPIAPAPPDENAVHEAIQILRTAERPVVIAGSGAWWADAAPELTRFIEHTSLPLFTVTMGRGVVSDEHPLCFGYADPALNRASLQAFQEADVVLVLGKRIDYRLAMGGNRLFAQHTRFIQVDVHAQELGLNRRLAAALHADLKPTLAALLESAGMIAWPALPWLDHLRGLRRDWQQSLQNTATDLATPLHPAAVFAEFRRHLPPDTILSWDGGDFVHWGRATLPALHPGAWFRLGPLGAIGSALPNALALQLAHPGKPVVIFTGDGSLGFYLAELDTAVRHGLPIIIVVGNDGGWGLERELQREVNASTVGCELRRTRYDEVMRGFGGGGECITSIEQIRPALERALASGIPYCLNIETRGTRSPFTEWQIAGKKR